MLAVSPFLFLEWGTGILDLLILDLRESELQERFKNFAVLVHQFTRLFPKERVYVKIEEQLTRASSSSAANYRAACRGKSISDFINKLCIVEEETDESIFWLEYTNAIDHKWVEKSAPILREGNER